ncbi:hypothetical protein Trydic_g17637 [Trypoxylus dichotomus]
MYADDVCIFTRSLNARIIERRLQTALDTAGLICKVENRCPSRESHGRAFLNRRSLKKEARQPSRTHLLRTHHPLATTNQILGAHIGFPSELGSAHTPCPRSQTSNVGNPLFINDRAREARSLT